MSKGCETYPSENNEDAWGVKEAVPAANDELDEVDEVLVMTREQYLHLSQRREAHLCI